MVVLASAMVAADDVTSYAVAVEPMAEQPQLERVPLL